MDFFIAPLTSLGYFFIAMWMVSFPQLIRRTFIWLGHNTMMIMAVHLPVMRSMVLLRPLVGSWVVYKVLEELGMWFVPCLFSVIANRYAPWIVGKKNHRKY